MNREELIEAAANAMSQGYVQDGRISSFFALAEAALAVFEKAQCKRCGKIAEGYAFIGDDRYCHPDDGVDCYTLASHELTSLANQAFIEKAQAPTDEEREDMIAWLMRDHGDDLSPLGRDYTDAEIAGMLRRPARTEPTDAQMDAAREAIRAQRKYDMRPLNFACPSCGSKPGESCYGNGPMREPHFIRVNPEPVEERYARAALKGAFAAGQEEQS